jgi:hypothetical protein
VKPREACPGPPHLEPRLLHCLLVVLYRLGRVLLPAHGLEGALLDLLAALLQRLQLRGQLGLVRGWAFSRMEEGRA